MFTLNEWDAFCATLSNSPCKCILPRDFSVRKARCRPTVVVKHDVEADMGKALEVARIERRHGISAVFYVHSFFLREIRASRQLMEITRLGHEVGYHYDVLDSNEGDMDAASREFVEAVTRFSELGIDIRSSCPHGNPLKSFQPRWGRKGHMGHKIKPSPKHPRRATQGICSIQVLRPVFG